MRRVGLFGALALLLVVNAAVLGGVAWNRSGQPEATLQLTERELPLSYRHVRLEKNSGLALTLGLFRDSRSPDWLNERKLRALGFRPERYYAMNESGYERDKRALPRRAYVVLEFDGPAWQAALEEREQQLAELSTKIAIGEATVKQRERLQNALQRMRHSGSRLVAVDAGDDAAVLRGRYPDATRYLITSAEFHMRIDRSESAERETGRPVVRGHIARIHSRRIHVPLQHRAALQSVLYDKRRGRRHRSAGSVDWPRYAVTLNFGKRHEPWVAGISGLDAGLPNPQ
jgi:hypothetical protein